MIKIMKSNFIFGELWLHSRKPNFQLRDPGFESFWLQFGILAMFSSMLPQFMSCKCVRCTWLQTVAEMIRPSLHASITMWLNSSQRRLVGGRMNMSTREREAI